MNVKKHEMICRTCLKVINDNELYTTGETRTNCGAVIDILDTCVSEMNFDLTHEVLLCCNCFTMLRIAYDFKLKCLNTEERVFTYLQKHNLPLSHKIHLTNVITDVKDYDDIERGVAINETNMKTTNDYSENYISNNSLMNIASEASYGERENINKQTANTTASKFSGQLNTNMNRGNEYSVVMFNNAPLLTRVVNGNCINSLINADCNIVLENNNFISKDEECFDSIFYE